MGKVIGLFACTTLVATTLWLASPGETTKTVSAGTDPTEFLNTTKPQASSRDFLQQQKAYFQDESSPLGGSGRYTRSKPNSQPTRAGDSYPEVARKMLADARQLALKGDIDGARRLAQRASAFPVKWNPNEQSPEQLLRDLDSRGGNPGQTMSGEQGFGGSTGNSSTGAFDPLGFGTDPNRTRIDDFMRRAYIAHRRGDVEEALRLASSADQAARNFKISFGPGEESPAAFIGRIQGQQSTGNPFANQQDSAFQRRSSMEVTPAAHEVVSEGTPFDPFGDTASDRSRTASTSTAARSNEPQISESEIFELPTGPSANKQLASELLRQARKDLQAGRFDQARSNAMRAQELKVPYGLFEEQPRHLLAEIERKSGSTIFAGAPAQQDASEGSPFASAANNELEMAAESPASSGNPFGDVTPPQSAGQEKSQQAKTLLTQARSDMKAGRFDDARQKAMQAKELNVAYTVFNDRPELVLSEIDTAVAIAQAEKTSQQPANDNKQLADSYLRQANADLKAGRLDEARRNVEEARKLGVAYDLFDDTPEIVMAEIERASQPTRTPSPDNTTNDVWGNQAVAQAPAAKESNTFAEFNSAQDKEFQPSQNVITRTAGTAPQGFAGTQAAADPFGQSREMNSGLGVIQSSGMAATDLFRQGKTHLQRGDTEAAYNSFLQAYQSGQRLDAYQTQQLQDYLRELAPRGRSGIRLASNQVPGPIEAPGALNSGSGELGVVEQQQAIQFDRLRSEVLNAVFEAEKLRETKPAQAIEILDQTMLNVENSNLKAETLAPLVRSLSKTRASVEAWQKQQEPILALKSRNDEVETLIRREQEHKYRVEQEFAELVEQFNRLMSQRRFADAEIIAKQAKEIDPSNPVSETLIWKSKFARRVTSNASLVDRKENATWEAWNEVEEAAIPHFGRPMQFGKDWDEITSRRRGKYGPDNRVRTEEEQRIEKSLSRPISLHFENAALKDVIKHVATVAGVNVVLDNLGLEDEGVTTNTPVSIDVDGIMLKSALNLLLEPMHLNYTVEDEVLKITSHMRQQGRLVVSAYPVADLVVPIPNFAPSIESVGLPTRMGESSLRSAPGANMSFPSTGGQFQLPSRKSKPWMGNSGMDVELGGGGAATDFGELTSLIVSTVEPDSWTEVGGPGTMRGFETTLSLVVRQTQKVHEEIADLLTQLRRLQDLQVTIEVRFVTVADRFFERIGIDFDFNIPDTVGGPDVDQQGRPLPAFGAVSTLQGGQQAQQGQQGQQGGQQGQGGQAGVGGIGGATGLSPTLMPARTNLYNDSYPTLNFGGFGSASGGFGLPMGGQLGFGGIGGQAGQQQGGQQGQQGQQQGQQGQQQGQQGVTTGGFFQPGPTRNLVNRDSYGSGGTIVGLSAPNTFTQDLDIAFRQGSFEIGVPDFGGFNPDAGIQVGLAILSDIETFFFIQAAQGDERSNLMFAPKVTLFNGQTATVSSQVARPFVISLTPTVGFNAVGFTPQIATIPEGVSLQVQAVISADRRFVRLSVLPVFSNITDVFTFSFVSGGGGGGQTGQQGLGGQQQQGAGGFGGGGQGGFGGGGQGGGGGLGVGGIGGIAGGQGGGQVGGQQGGQIGGQQGQQGQQQGQQNAVGGGTVTVQQPVVEFVSVSTTVSVPDGGTVLLGGIKRLREGRNMAGVPILNKIPYISRLFKNTGVGRETESLMLMVTPRIIIQEEEEELLGVPL